MAHLHRQNTLQPDLQMDPEYLRDRGTQRLASEIGRLSLLLAHQYGHCF